MSLDGSQLERALRETGGRLTDRGVAGPLRLYVLGGSAGVLNEWLPPSRTTGDVDVTAVEPEESWKVVSEATREVAEELELPQTWLNDACKHYRWCLPLGWRARCTRARTYGPLEVWLLHRSDFIATKIVAARSQDLEDLRAIQPTEAELAFTEEHIDRLKLEHLDPDHTFEDARAVLNALRGGS